MSMSLSFLIQQLSRWCNTIAEKIVFVMGYAISIILFLQVICRYCGYSLSWSEEISRFLLVGITFIGGSVAYKKMQFIKFEGFGKIKIIRFLMQVLTFLCFIFIFVFGAKYTLQAWYQNSPAIEIPMAVPYTVLPLSAILIVVHTLAEMIDLFKRRTQQ